MEDDWEALAGAKAEQLFAKADGAVRDKWAGEDEDDVKESWEDEEEEEEKKDESKGDKSPAKNAKPKKTAQQKQLEKEENDERLRREEEAEASLTPEQRLAEKRRLQKLQEENDLKTAMETLGITSMSNSGGIDGMHPTTKEEFADLADAISKKLSNYRAHQEYQGFLEDLLLKVFASLSSNSIRKAKTTLDNLYLEKQKVEKGDKPKKTKGVKVKARLRVEGENSEINEYATKYDDFDEYDDFM
ncbi:eukaryotic translation initiation factor 3 subunit J isoform X2 [Anopheles coustani]|uniref:eukaryotic translation initiation factor 3 subunit J isoform X2 n=1 Tax=Anopheles coustani TaxID=139045 RepID=UPI00265A0BE8|nr:eukaryotic translation initiation factor 3 subunit J isoform X2 [Anopheles coustani]